MQEFFINNDELNGEGNEPLCCIFLKSGKLEMNEVEIFMDGITKETYRKVPAIIAWEGTELVMTDCKLRGDRTNDANTAGIVAINSQIQISGCNFENFKCGGIMVQAMKNSLKPIVEIMDNTITTCGTNGIYV